MAQPFRIVLIDVAIDGSTRIQWDLDPSFQDPLDYSFQLQFGRSGDPDGDDWINVGSPVINTFFAIDTTKRVFGKSPDGFYRVILTTINGVYIANPVNMNLWMQHYQWRIAKEVIRKEQLRHRLFASVPGYILVRRRYGPKCPDCLDTNTDEIVNASDCTTCYGTGIVGGYYAPIAGVYADVSLLKAREQIDLSRGTTRDMSQGARFIAYPKLRSYDVWVNKHSDERYYLHTIEESCRLGNTIVIQTAEIRLAPYTDIIYSFNVNV